MQQRQSKSVAEAKKTNSFSKMMLQRDKNRLQAKQKQPYIELLKDPRGKEYLRLLAESTGICKQLEEIEEQLKQLEQEIKQEEAMLPASNDCLQRENENKAKTMSESVSSWLTTETEEKVLSWLTTKTGENNSSWLTTETEENNSSWLTTKEEETVSSWLGTEVKEEEESWLDVKRGPIDIAGSCEQKRKHLMQMQKRRDELVVQFKEAQKAFQEQLPIPEKCLGLIYPDWNTDILLKYGIIACPGNKFSTPEELIAQVQPRTQEEERQWLKGNDAYQMYFCEELLLVEIYRDVVCVVYKGGNVKVIE